MIVLSVVLCCLNFLSKTVFFFFCKHKYFPAADDNVREGKGFIDMKTNL